MGQYDCQRCGACCVNPRVNADEGTEAYVEISDPRAKLLRDRSLRRKYVADIDGVAHLRLIDGRCAALRGATGRRVWCVVYAHRPLPCRRVQPGDGDCLRARAEAGLPV